MYVQRMVPILDIFLFCIRTPTFLPLALFARVFWFVCVNVYVCVYVYSDLLDPCFIGSHFVPTPSHFHAMFFTTPFFN